MLRIDLGQLDREGSVDVVGTIPGDHELWQDAGFEWAGDLDVRLRASYAGSGEVVVRGTADGTVRQQCRRCLEKVETRFTPELTMVFVADPSEEEDDGGVYAFEPAGTDLELSSAVREEAILAIEPYAVCSPECRGLCPQCGTNLNEGSCDCTTEEVDPRWAALRDLKSE